MTITPRSRSRAVADLASALVVVAASVMLPALPTVAAPVAEPRRWVWPVGAYEAPPRVDRAFAPPVHRWQAGHRGVDLAAAAGTPVLAAGAGRVAYAGLLAGRGVVSVVHGELRTTYEPVQASVRVGQQVAEGDVIGSLQPGGHCAPDTCLHWGLRRGEVYLDPLALVASRPVRLLPLGPAAVRASPVRASRPPRVSQSDAPLRPDRHAPGPRDGSGSGVRLLVRGAQPLGGDVGVDLRRRE